MLIKLARLSLWNRRGTVLLTWLSLTISIALLLGIDHLRTEAKSSFTSTISGTDLIVGARSGQLNLLLYSVFRIGNATANISWASYQRIRQHPQIAWTIPISLGDSHRGYRVMGTTADYFNHYRYANSQTLTLQQGTPFADVFETVLGADVAQQLGYTLGQKIELSHGIGAVSFSKHSDKPFTVVGILSRTGTPVDQTVHVSLQAIEAIHLGWQHGVPIPGRGITADQAKAEDLTPNSITALLIGLTSRMATFTLQRQLNEFKQEPLTAILPGVALAELWQMLGMVENMLLLISLLVLVAALVGMTTTLLAAMKERQREMAVLRAAGAHPGYLFMLIQLEVLFIVLSAMAAAAALLLVTMFVLQDKLAAEFGLFIGLNIIKLTSLYWAAGIIILAVLLAVVPGVVAYRKALADGLTVRL
jgi:putative ABC transport system permease protein